MNKQIASKTKQQLIKKEIQNESESLERENEMLRTEIGLRKAKIERVKSTKENLVRLLS